MNEPLPLSIRAWILRATAVRLLRRALRPDRDLEYRRKAVARLTSSASLKLPSVTITPATLATVPGEWIRPKRIDGALRTILYLHGGAYQVGSPATHRGLTQRLARDIPAQVFAADYRLAPEDPYPAAVEDAVAVYQGLLESGIAPDTITLMGDSAGGGLAVATALGARDLALPSPGTVVTLSPWADLTLSGASMLEREADDPMLDAATLEEAADNYAGADDRGQSLASPGLADLSRLPPVATWVGTDEVLYDDAVALDAALQRDGVPSTLHVGHGLWHVWPLFAGLMPEATQTLGEICEHIRGHTSAQTAA